MSYHFSRMITFDIEHLLSLPCHVYWKNNHGIYLDYNDYGVKCLGFKHHEVIGHSDAEIFPRTIAGEFKKNDLASIKHKKQIFIHENGILKNKLKVVFHSYKMPLFDDDESIIGVLGLSFTRSPESRYPSSKLEKNINFNSLATCANTTLSNMEITCVRHICQGLTSKQTARCLKLSPRTVEAYLERAKIKLNCPNKAQLMWTMINKFST